MPKRPLNRRRGTIVARGADRWLVQVSLGKNDVTGKWQRASRVVTGPRHLAEVALTEMLRKQDTGAPLPRGRMTLASWLAEYEHTWSGSLAPRTRMMVKQSFRLYLPAPIQAQPLVKLTPKTFQELYNAQSAAGLAPNTVRYLHRALSTRLKVAVAHGHLAVNPLKVVKPPAKRHLERRTLTPSEARYFLEEADASPTGALWALLLWTGLRPEEALGLRWDDWEGAVLRIRRALVRVGTKWELMSTKTKRERSLVLPAPAVRILQRHRARQNAIKLQLGSDYPTHGLIFATPFGQPLHWSNVVARQFRPLMARVAHRSLGQTPAVVVRKGIKRADLGTAFAEVVKLDKAALGKTGLDRLRPYDLRHSAATLLLAAGEHPKVVAELLGHASITMTLATYSHVVPGMLERAAERLEATIYAPLEQATGS